MMFWRFCSRIRIVEEEELDDRDETNRKGRRETEAMGRSRLPPLYFFQ